jgi:cytochrome c2
MDKTVIYRTLVVIIWGLCACILGLSACEKQKPVNLSSNKRTPEATVAFYQCARCHSGEKLPPHPEFIRDCRGCHKAIKEGDLNHMYPKDKIETWSKRINHFYITPDLSNLSHRLRYDWFLEFLQKPHIVRPRLGSMMPKMMISKVDAEKIADFFYTEFSEPKEIRDWEMGNAKRGQSIFAQKDCASCHLPKTKNFSPEQMMAPMLEHSSSRMSRQQMYYWLKNPKEINPSTLMPNFDLSDKEILDLIAYLQTLGRRRQEDCNVSIKPQLLERKVGYSDIEKRVLKKTCWHCHSDPVPAGGDGGPGNTGGFGYPGKGVDFSSQQSFIRVRGKLPSIISDTSRGYPIVVEHLLQRHREIECSEYTEVTGMPLGLPAVSVEDINLIYSWIRQNER